MSYVRLLLCAAFGVSLRGTEEWRFTVILVLLGAILLSYEWERP